MKVDYGELRHFCDDLICPDPVWKLSMHSLQIGSLTALLGALVFWVGPCDDV